jgi:hypothetical protein
MRLARKRRCTLSFSSKINHHRATRQFLQIAIQGRQQTADFMVRGAHYCVRQYELSRYKSELSCKLPAYYYQYGCASCTAMSFWTRLKS